MLNLYRLTSCTLLYSLTYCLLAVLLQLTAILRPLTYTLLHLRNSAHLYRSCMDTDLQKTHDVIAIQPVHWRSGWTYRKHISRDRYLPLCDVTTDTKKHSFPYCCVRLFRAWLRDDVHLLLRFGICLQSCGLAMGIHVTILIYFRMNSS
jgi:hypothetical protein